jgi:hypothetical protein
MNAKEIVREIIDTKGRDIIAHKQKLNAVIADLMLEDKRMRFLLELSIKAGIPEKISTFFEGEYYDDFSGDIVYSVTEEDLILKLNYLKIQFKEDYSMEMKAVAEVFDCWVYALEPEPKMTTNSNFGIEYEFIDWKSNIIAGEFVDAENFKEGLAAVSQSDNELITEWEEWDPSMKNYGFIDRNGEEVIPFRYDMAESFNGGLALVQLNGKIGYIDRKGNWVKDK